MKVLVIGLASITVTAAALLFAGLYAAAWLVGNVGTLLFLFMCLAWIVVCDSRRKWPGVGWFTRLSYVLTFRR